jgi:hypothetical protein
VATSFLAPAIARSREIVISRSTKAVLTLVPELKKAEGEEISARAFVILLSSALGIGLLSLLTINTLLTQDAFVLQRLKHNVNMANDQRDAILRNVATQSSPENLSMAAQKMGMVPATNPQFIDISLKTQLSVSTSTTSHA